MWLGSGQLVRQVGIGNVLVLSTQVKPVESARNLGFIIDSQLLLSAPAAALCRSGISWSLVAWLQLCPAVWSLTTECREDSSSCVHYISPQLL